MEPPAQPRVPFDREKPEGGIGGPINLYFVAPALDPGFAKSGFFLPLAVTGRGFDLEAGVSQGFNVSITGASHLLGQFVENVKIVREAGGIIGRVQDDATGEVTFLGPVAGQNS